MKQINFLSKSSSQSMGLRSVTLASTVGSPSAHRRATMLKLISILVLILTFGVGNVWGAETVSVNIGTYATANSWTNESQHATVTIDANVTATGLTNGNNSKYYTSNSSWRHYEGNSGTITIATSSGTISSITFTYANGNSGVIKYNNTNKTSGTAISVSGSSVSFTVGHSSGTKNGNVQITAISVTYTPAASKTLSSITITTPPTTTKYLDGETFSKSGAVVTANYDDSSTANVSSSATWNKTTLGTSDTQVTASYTEGGVTKTADQSINVYSVTVQKQDETGATITADGVSASASGRTLTASATPASHYVFKGWKYGTAAGTSISNATSATTGALTGTPSGAVTVIAEFYKPIPVTWNSNGSLHATTYTGYNQKPVFPDEPSSCSDESNTFYGWATSTWDNTVDNLAGKTVYTSADDMSNVTSAGTTYNAVFAKASAGSASWTKVTNSISAGDVIVIVNEAASKELTSIGDISGTSCGKTSAYSTTPAGTFPLTVETGNGGTGFSFKNGSNYLSWSSGNSLTTSTTKNNASSWTVNNPSSGNYTFSNRGDNTRKLQYNSGSPRFCCYTSSQQAFQIYRQNSSTTYSNYLTTCCTPLGSINGSVFWPTFFSYLTC